MNIELGAKYTDKISGFTGTAVGKSQWLTGCETVGLQAPVDKDGKVPDACWFDAIRLVQVESAKAEIKSNAAIGGPQLTPQRTVRGQ